MRRLTEVFDVADTASSAHLAELAVRQAVPPGHVVIPAAWLRWLRDVSAHESEYLTTRCCTENCTRCAIEAQLEAWTGQ